MHLYELPVYLPADWRVQIQYDRLTLIAPNRAIAEALQLGAAQSLRATSQRLGVPVEIVIAARFKNIQDKDQAS